MSKKSKQNRSDKKNNKINYLLQVKVTITEGKTSIQTARRMVFEAQDHRRIVDLDHLTVLISSTTTANINHRRILIDDLWGLISNLWRLVCYIPRFLVDSCD